MSRPFPNNQPLPHLAPELQVKHFADLYRTSVNPTTLAQLETKTQQLGLPFSAGELLIIAALDTPIKVQEFLNTQIYYNNDHASADLEETAMSPRRVLQTGIAHCFEGALFAYAVNYLHGYNPRLVLLEASQDSDHNLVLFRNERTGWLGAVAHSSFPHLDGRPAKYSTLRALVESFMPYYYSDRTNNPNDLTLVGYSEPMDLTAKFGIEWMASEKHLWDIYYTYIDDTWRFHYLFDDSTETHWYPVVRALKENWIRIDAFGKPFVSVNDLPTAAQNLWHAFWREFDESQGPRPQSHAREIEKEFMRLTGTTPIDLSDNASDFQYYLDAGFRVEDIVNREQ